MPDHSLELANHPLAIRVRKQVVSAIAQYDMLTDGDKVMVAVSGGKDSSILMVLLDEIRRRAPFKFHLEAVLLDQKQPGFNASAFKTWVESVGIRLHILEENTYSIVIDKIPEGKTYCSLCSRLRRGVLYNFAHEQGFTKIALGHHRDDLIETALLNMFYSGKVASMPPKLLSDDKRNIIIRPLAFVRETELVELSREWAIPIIPCKLCGSQEGMKRERMKKLVRELEAENASVGGNILSALQNVKPSQLLDKSLWNFEALISGSTEVDA